MPPEKNPELKRLRTKLSIDILWIYILGILKEKPLHAYALRKEISERFGFKPGNVTAYVVLYKLKNRGFVSAKAEANRTVYSITEKGKGLFKEAEKEFSTRQRLIFK